jgi:hypothetical protein
MSYADRPLSLLELLPEALSKDLQRRHVGACDSRWREAHHQRLEGGGAPWGSCTPNCGGLQRARHARRRLLVAQLWRQGSLMIGGSQGRSDVCVAWCGEGGGGGSC